MVIKPWLLHYKDFPRALRGTPCADKSGAEGGVIRAGLNILRHILRAIL